jgi:hypothetical protein
MSSQSPYRAWQGPGGSGAEEPRPSRAAELESALRSLLLVTCGALAAGRPANGGDWAAIPMDHIALLRRCLSEVVEAVGLTLDERAQFFSLAMVRADLAQSLEAQVMDATTRLRAAEERAEHAERLLEAKRIIAPPPSPTEPAVRYGWRRLTVEDQRRLLDDTYEAPPGTRAISVVDDGQSVLLEFAPRARTAYRG